jgi:wyosine [tRNA(Phe)-imidazoG37] synthetase (radical SAM superfamily)
MQERLQQMKTDAEDLDVITFAGNGEPTLHPEFAGIINDTIELRNLIFPNARIAVLSNSTMLHKTEVLNALLKVDQNILKLDSGFDSTIKKLNQPHKNTTVDEVVSNLRQFKGNFTLQTLFVRGSHNGEAIDNTTPEELERWINIVADLKPKDVMVYTIARDTPINTLQKVPTQELESIAQRVRAMGIPVQVSG